MFIDFNKIFFPTKEQKEGRLNFLTKIHEESLRKNGKVCSNCRHNIYVQESPYSDRMDCEFGKINVSDGCDKWEESIIYGS